MSEKVIVFDTTLRDGEQAAGVCFSKREKLEIASRLAAMRVDVIEAGFPAASDAEAQAVAGVARVVRDATICALARAVPADVDAAHQTTMTRDLAVLIAGGYRLTDLVPLEMFPHTPHLEVLARLVPASE